MAIKNIDVIDVSAEENIIDDNMKLIKNFRTQNVIDINMVRVFIMVWIAASIVALLPILRPNYSEVEKRELKNFPKFSFSSLFSGEYFDEINLWFSDTFPMRDNFVSLNTKVTNMFGINTVQVHGNVTEGDKIPETEESVDSKPTITDETNSEEIDAPSSPENTSPPHAVEQLGAMLIVDNAAYEYYNFIQSTADKYIGAVNRAANLLEGKCTVYDMIVPTSMAITLPESYNVSTNSSDQKKSINYMYSKMNESVCNVETYNSLSKHKDEYIYFRTDHHWTSLGAYYAYKEFANIKGVKPAELTDFNEYKFEGFLGSFYAESGQKASLGNDPDYVMAYEPKQLQKIHTFTSAGEIDYHIVSNGDDLSAPNKYLTFICGDHPYGIMTNPTINDGSSCLVIKESFGNAMVAYLTQHYQNVHVVDYRYINQVFKGNLQQFVDEKSINDVIFLNNISSTRNTSLVDALSVFIG